MPLSLHNQTQQNQIQESQAQNTQISDKKAQAVPLPVRRSLNIWNRIPQWVNRFVYLLKSQPTNQADYLDYDPFCLRVFTNQRYNAFGDKFYVKTLQDEKLFLDRINQKEMDLETFKLTIEQIPSVKSVEFSGRGEPLLNPDIFQMIEYARRYNGAESGMVTNGHLLKKYTHHLLNSSLGKLCIQLHGHKPSIYHQMSGLDAHNFVPIVENIKHFLTQRKACVEAFQSGGYQKHALNMVISMTVDVHTFSDIPEMIAFAYELGADGVVINNFLSDNPQEASERTLYTDQEVVKEYLSAIGEQLAKFENFEVTLPTLLERDMSTHRFCQEAYTTVAVDGNCNVYPCSRQLLQDEIGEAPKIWEPNFWNHDSYHLLRNIHSRSNKSSDSVPSACQNCPRNLA